MGIKRYELSDVQWERIAPMLPGKASDPGRTAADNRLFVNAVLWVLRSGARLRRARPQEAAFRDRPPRQEVWEMAAQLSAGAGKARSSTALTVSRWLQAEAGRIRQQAHIRPL